MSSAPSQAPGPEAETETWSLPKCDIGAQQERGYMLPNLRGPIHDIVVYETHKTLLVVGYNLARTEYKVLLIDRTDPTRLQMTALPRTYTRAEINLRLRQEMEDGKTGMQKMIRAYGIVGFMRFTESFYMLLITGRRKAGVIGGRYVYEITTTHLVRLSNVSRLSSEEQRYRSLFKMVDLANDFYFSYSYDLTNTLQHNMTTWEPEGGTVVTNDRFVWNKFLLKGLAMSVPETKAGEDWFLPICCGFFSQKSVRIQGGALLRMTLLARRSNRFAGTRYLRRGVNARGDVANEVETEMILEKERMGEPPRFAALVQVRGSIPLWWRHRNIFVPKPDVEITHNDPAYVATRRHYNRLFRRFGHPVVTLSLIKEQEKKPIERVVGRAFSRAILRLNEMLANSEIPSPPSQDYNAAPKWSRKRPASFVNPGRVLTVPSLPLERTPILYIKFDFLNYDPEEHGGVSVLDAVEDLIVPAFARTGFFYTKGYKSHKAGPFDGVPQHGILRTNCMDCLDRTNIAQFVHARYALRHMVHALGVSLSREDYDALWGVLLTMFTEHGDAMAKQYGGSQAMHRATVQESSEPGHGAEAVITSGARNAMVAIRRYYSNNITDFEKQMGMNLFLGIFVPYRSRMHLWDMNLVPQSPAEASSGSAAPADVDVEENAAESADPAGLGKSATELASTLAASDPDEVATIGGGVEPGAVGPASLERSILLGASADGDAPKAAPSRGPQPNDAEPAVKRVLGVSEGEAVGGETGAADATQQKQGEAPAAARDSHTPSESEADAFGESRWLGYAITRTVLPLGKRPTGFDNAEAESGELTVFDALRAFPFNEPVLAGVGVPITKTGGEGGEDDGEADDSTGRPSSSSTSSSSAWRVGTLGRTLRTADVRKSARSMIKPRMRGRRSGGRAVDPTHPAAALSATVDDAAREEGVGGADLAAGDVGYDPPTVEGDGLGGGADGEAVQRFYSYFTDPETLGDASCRAVPPTEPAATSADGRTVAAAGEGGAQAQTAAAAAEEEEEAEEAQIAAEEQAAPAGTKEGGGEASPKVEPAAPSFRPGVEDAEQSIAAVAGAARGVIGGGVRALTGTAASIGRAAGKGIASSARTFSTTQGRRVHEGQGEGKPLSQTPGLTSFRDRASSGGGSPEAEAEDDVVSVIGSRFKKFFGSRASGTGRERSTSSPPPTQGADAVRPSGEAGRPASGSSPSAPRSASAGQEDPESIRAEIASLRDKLAALENRVNQ